jgi:hypothetical protein
LAKKRNLEITALLRATDNGDGNWLAAQSDEAQKEFQPLVAMRWAAGVKDGMEAAYMLWLINKRVNLRLFDLYADKELSFRLLATCGVHRPLRHEWLPMVRHKSTDNAAYHLLAKQQPAASDDELTMLLSLYDRETFKQLATDCGQNKDEIKTSMAAFDKVKAP